MTMNLVANQLELTNGVRRDRADCLLDAEQTIPPPTIQKRGALYIITETETMAAGQPRPGDIDLCREAQETILHEYYNFNPTATITSALRHALDKANQAIFNRNSAVLPPERRGLGVTIALVRGSEIYTAQLPPTQALLSHQGQIRVLPAHDRPEPTSGPRPVQARTGTDAQVTLPTPRAQSVPSLGRYSAIEPTLSRNVFEEGDVLVLCSSALAQAIKPEDLDWILANQESRSVLLNLSEFARNQNIADAYAMTLGVRPGVTPRRPAAHPEETGWRGTAEGVAGAVSLFASKFTPKGGKPSQASAEEAEPDPLAPLVSEQREDPWLRREDHDLNRPAYLRGRSPSMDTPPAVPVPPAPAAPSFSRSSNSKGQDEQGFKQQQAGFFRPGVQTPPPSPPRRDYTYTDASQEPTYQPNTVEPPLPRLSGAVGAEPEAAWGTPTAKKGWSVPKRSAARGQVAASPSNNPFFDMAGGERSGASGNPLLQRLGSVLTGRGPLLLLLGLGLVVAIAVLAVAISLAGNIGGNGNKAAELVQAAEQKRATAQNLAASQPARARALITQAQTDLDAARKEKPDLPDLTTMQNALRTTLDNINKVVIPGDLRQAMDLSSQGTGVRLSRAVINQTGDSLYLLDTGRGAVYNADMMGAVKTILKSGDKAAGAIFGKPLAMVARPDGLLVVDSGNIAWIYNRAANSWTAQALGGTSSWGSTAIRQAASYQGNLYVVGPASGQILKYNAGQYGGNPEEWLNPGLAPNLALDKANGLWIDGTIYALDGKGKILQLARPSGKDKGEVIQQYEPNAADKLGPPLSAPVAINAGSLDFPHLFVLDSEKRVMQFSKADGAFIQQFQAIAGRKEFDNLQDVVIDETNKKLYIVGLQKVHVFNLPASSSNPATPTGGNSRPVPAQTPGAGTNVTVIADPRPTTRP